LDASEKLPRHESAIPLYPSFSKGMDWALRLISVWTTAYATDTFIFGYLATGSLDIFELRQAELIIAGAILAMGATRQSRSHCKASMQVGNTEKVVAALVRAARRIARWNKQELSEDIVVSSLAQELKDNLAKEEAAKYKLVEPTCAE
jgi:hypothetical protein